MELRSRFDKQLKDQKATVNKNKADNPTAQILVDKSPSTVPHQVQGWTESSSDWTVPPAISDTAANSSGSIALEAQDLCVSYGGKQVLTDMSFTLYQGDTLGLLGLNGAGKSTLLKVLSGALAPNHGTVKIEENELFENIIASRLNIGYAPDKPAIYPEFRVTEYLNFIARMRRIERRKIKSCVDEVIDRCALGEVRKRVIGNLSTGYQQRVNIAQALLHTPKILILDEPANGLDPVQLIEMRELVLSLAPDQATIFSSHLLSEVNSICNRVMLINDGRQILDTPLAALSDKTNNSFEVHLANDSDFNLKQLPAVAQVCKTPAGHWLVTGDSLTEEHIYTQLHSRGQQTTLLKPVDNYLECLFRHLATHARSDSANTDNQGSEI